MPAIFDNPEFWVLIAFLIFAGMLVSMKVPATVGKALDDRAAGIRKDLDDAARLRKEAEQLLADYQRKAREAEAEAKSIIEAAKREAENLAAETKKALANRSSAAPSWPRTRSPAQRRKLSAKFARRPSTSPFRRLRHF